MALFLGFLGSSFFSSNPCGFKVNNKLPSGKVKESCFCFIIFVFKVIFIQLRDIHLDKLIPGDHNLVWRYQSQAPNKPDKSLNLQIRGKILFQPRDLVMHCFQWKSQVMILLMGKTDLNSFEGSQLEVHLNVFGLVDYGSFVLDKI